MWLIKKILIIPFLLGVIIAQAAAPNWSVNTAEYSNTMTFVAEVDSVVQTSANSKLAAFSQGQCRGVVTAKYISQLKKYYFYLVVSNKIGDNDTITFKYYDAATDSIYNIATKQIFQNNESLGSLQDSYYLQLAQSNIIDFTLKNSLSQVSINQQNQTITIHTATSTNVASIVPVFNVSLGAIATVNSTLQQSGVSSVDLTTPVTYTIKASDGTLQQWTVNVVNDLVLLNFALKDGLLPIKDATISIPGYDDVITNENGVATVIVTANSQIDYTIKIDGKKDSTATINVENKNLEQTVDFKIVEKKSNVNLIITSNSIFVEGAKFSLEGYGDFITNSFGKVSISGILSNKDINFIIKAKGYNDTLGKINIVANDSTLTLNVSPISYKVAFALKNSGTPIVGAKVILDGYGEVASDNFGIATFNNVLPQNNVTVLIQAQGYADSISNISIVDQNILQVIQFNPIVKTCSVSIVLKHENTLVEGAKITLNGYGEIVTNSLGIATIKGVVANQDVDYIIKAQGYIDSIGTLQVGLKDTTVHISLQMITYFVNFTIANASNPIAGATVTLEGYGDSISNNLGVVSFANVQPQISLKYIIKATGYNDSVAYISVVDKNVNTTINFKTSYIGSKVSFVVKSGIKLLQNATITVDGYGDIVTNGLGKTTLPGVILNQDISYVVKCAGYSDVVSKFNALTNEFLVNVEMKPLVYKFTIVVKNKTSVLVGAKVSLMGYSVKTTDSWGMVTFDNIPANSNLTYAIKASGYIDSVATIVVNNADVSKTIKLAQVSTSIEKQTIENVVVYPNPFQNHIMISAPEDNYTVKLIDCNGRIVMNSMVTSNEQVDTQKLNSGIYTIFIESQDGDSASQIIIKK